MKARPHALYRTLELPGANPLKAAHAALDAPGLPPSFPEPKTLVTEHCLHP